jgi:DNA-binding NarL/FixJ family response regulator
MKILLVDDHAIMRDGLRAVLERESDMQLAGEASNGRDAVELALRLRPCVIVMDIGMPGLNGIDATREILSEHRAAKVIALSMNSDRRYVLAMFAVGAVGYLVKDAAASELILAIRTVVQNRAYVSPAVAEDVIASVREAYAEHPTKELSGREREVLQLIAEGKTSKDIAAALHLAVPTVETHRRQLMGKLGIRSIAELTKYAVREGLTLLEK